MDQRRDQLCHWINQQLKSQNLYQGPLLALDMVSGDASFRRYFRCHYPVGAESRSVICVDAPPDKENNPQFARIAEHYLAAGVAVPELLATDFEQGFMMLSDLGDRLLKTVLSANNVDAYFATAQAQLLQIMRADFSQQPLPPYDSELLLREMELFRHWFCGVYLRMELSAQQHLMLSDSFDYLQQQALQQPQVPVHRDYHTRNLMVLKDGQLGVIDFQDAVQGPVTYDLLSLLRDETFPAWPQAQVKDWVMGFARSLRQQNICKLTDQQLWHDFNAIGAQRHLKVAGIFARLRYRDNKQGYLQHTPQSLRYLIEELQVLQSTAPDCIGQLSRWLSQVVVPQLDKAQHTMVQP